MVYQERWDKTRQVIAELMTMEREGRYGMSRERMDSIRGFLVYVSSTYKYMTPYLKGVNLTLDSWIPFRDKDRWRLRGEALNMAEVEGKWERIEYGDKNTLVMGVLRLKCDSLALGIFTEDLTPPWRQLGVQRQAVSYIMGDASGFFSIRGNSNPP